MTWRFDRATQVALSEIFWRMLAPRWSFDPLSGAGAARAGGRWNQPGQPALYLSESHATAIAEYQQNLPRPGTLTGYRIHADAILDLTDPSTNATLGISNAFMTHPWKRDRDIARQRPPSWNFARDAAAAGHHGLRVPSAQTSGTNLILWHWTAITIQVLDPAGDLPRNDHSWKNPNPTDPPP